MTAKCTRFWITQAVVVGTGRSRDIEKVKGTLEIYLFFDCDSRGKAALKLVWKCKALETAAVQTRESWIVSVKEKGLF